MKLSVINEENPLKHDRLATAGVTDLPTKVWPTEEDFKDNLDEFDKKLLDQVDEMPKESDDNLKPISSKGPGD